MDDISFKRYFAFSVPYGAIVASLYLFGYWGAFEINILEFVGFSELVKLAAYPLLASLTFLIIGYALSELFHGDSLPPGGGADTKIGRFGRKYWRSLLAVHISVVVLIGIFGQAPEKWFVVASLASVLSVPLSHLAFFISVIPDPRIRGSVLFLLFLVAGMAFAYGRLDAHLAKTGFSPQVVDVTRSNLSLQSDKKKPVAYLGYVGGYFMLYESATGSVVIMKPKNDNAIFLLGNPNHS